MYAVAPEHPVLTKYLSSPTISSIGFDEQAGRFTMAGAPKKGLLKFLKKFHYPVYSAARRRGGGHPSKRASSRRTGVAIDRHLFDYVRVGKRPRNPMARAVVHYIENVFGGRLVGAQIPVYVRRADRVTAADVVAEDAFGNLVMFEIKSGWNQAKAQGMLRNVPEAVGSRPKTHWELQRHYTHQGMVAEGLPVSRSYVLNVYMEKNNKITVDRREPPAWAKKLR